MLPDAADTARRAAILDAEIERYVALGYRVQARTATTAQLVRPKTFSAGWAIFWLLMLFVGLLIYLLYHVSKSDATVYLTVDEDGEVRAQFSGNGPRPPGARGQPVAGWQRAGCGRLNSAAHDACKRCGTANSP
jgi:hypothetical protein